mmetsp:Transcript_8733/g.13038  ORF Transcript_8733/g.13038 Transcript_8733/m.13038 type:complete len:263 (-) Transcript_8733:123-911(-)
MCKTTTKKAKPGYKKKKKEAVKNRVTPMKKVTNSAGAPENPSETAMAKDDGKNNGSKRAIQRIFSFGNFQPHRSYLEKVLPRYSSPLKFSIQSLSFHESTLSSMVETNTFDLILHEMSRVEGVTRPLLIICLGMNHFRDKRSSIEILASIVTLHERAHSLGIQTIALELPANTTTENKKVGSTNIEEEARRMDVNNRLRFWAEGKQVTSNMICFVPFAPSSCDAIETDTRTSSSSSVRTDNPCSIHNNNTEAVMNQPGYRFG